MIIFKKLTYRNFLSTGNVPNTIELDKHSSTLVTGRNGDGKSTMLCALTFALFGKPFRNVNKGQLVNSINQKNCLVELEFTTNAKNYLIKRGIKPNVFEIWCNGEMLNQDAALKDYQKVLEQQILKLNYKTFTQVVILGSATFVPFMQLPSTARREVIEDILDIKVFSLMNQILKEKTASVKEEMQRIESEILNQRTKIQAQKKLIEALESSRQSVIDSLQQKINTNNQTITDTTTKITTLSEEVVVLQEKQAKHDEVTEALTKAARMKMKIGTAIDACNHNIEFFNENEVCPSCSQHIDDSHKHKIVGELDGKIKEQQKKYEDIDSAITKLDAQLELHKASLNDLRDKTIEISTLNSTISLLREQNTSLAKEIEDATVDTSNLTEEKTKMKEFAVDAVSLVNNKQELLDTKQLHDVAGALLKDTGIKTAIIKEYLPVMNKLVNKYLAAMDFFVKFELDDSFTEMIKSRNRDIFTYDSFSEGEKRRIDLAILFTWRQIAKMKNSVNTNIMILDEILDGALDAGGIDFFLSIMNQFGDHTNVFVISHKVDQMIDRFDHVIRVEKKNDFSVIVST